MKLAIPCTLCLAIAVTVALPEPLLAQDKTAAPATPTTQVDGKYHLAVAKTHNLHANDHLMLLQKYAQAHKTVPADVLQDHVASINHHVQAARNSYSKVAAAHPDEADLQKQLDEVQKRLVKVSGMVKKLETQSTDSEEVLAQTAEITKELAANHVAAKRVDDNFYNMESSDYYEDGLGHFTD